MPFGVKCRIFLLLLSAFMAWVCYKSTFVLHNFSIISSRTHEKRTVLETPEGAYTVSSYPKFTSLERFLGGPAAPYFVMSKTTNNLTMEFPARDDTRAVCEFQDIRFSKHFPHAMQQLLRCFSWWRANPHQRPILVLPHTNNLGYNEKRSLYTKEFLMALRSIWKVQVRTATEPITTENRGNASVLVRLNRAYPFQMQSTRDAQVLRDGILEYLELDDSNNSNGCPKTADDTTDPPSQQQEQSGPVVGFLNRQGGRRVSNHGAIVAAISDSTNATVLYQDSFDGLSFAKQIEFMSQVDILVGPHGAQFTSIPYIPACGGLLEVFPIGYYVPNFFGTLAAATGHHHASIYTGNLTNAHQEISYYSANITLRSQARTANIVADPSVVVEAVEELTRQWRSCCAEESTTATISIA